MPTKPGKSSKKRKAVKQRDPSWPSADLTQVCEMAGYAVEIILARRDQFLAGKFEFMILQVATTH